MSILKKVILILAAVITISACDQLGMSGRSSVVVVDLNAVAQALGRDEVMKKEVVVAENKLREQLSKIAGDIQGQVSEEQKKLDVKRKKADQEKMQQIAVQAQQTFQKSKIAAEQQAARFRQELIIKFREDVKSVAEGIAQERGAKVIKVLADDVLWFDPGSDITGEIISRMRASVE